MEWLTIAATIVTLCVAIVKSLMWLYRWGRPKLAQHWTREPKASDFVLTLPVDENSKINGLYP